MEEETIEGNEEAPKKKLSFKRDELTGLDKEKQKEINDNSVKINFTIKERTLTERIKRVLTLPKYNSLKQLITEAIEKGIILIEAKEFGIKEEDEKRVDLITVQELSDSLAAEISRLLSEICVSTVVTRSLIASVYNEKLLSLSGEKVLPELFNSSAISELPKYLSDWERKELEKIKVRFG